METDNKQKIAQARITAYPKSLFDEIPKVIVNLDNGDGTVGSDIVLFSFYPDEICFSPGEFKGLTLEEGRHLKFIKDKQYLQS